MPVIVALLRGVNIGGHNKMRMERLRALCESSLKLESPQTYVQSGNLVFRTRACNLSRLAKSMEEAIEGEFGFRPCVVLRSAAGLRAVIAQNPFAGRPGIEPNKLAVLFLSAVAPPSDAAGRKALSLAKGSEELHLRGRELFIYFPDGQGRSKLPWGPIERALGCSYTGRNWNTVLKLTEMATKLETGGSAQA
jgi:uncharacterized protein (DUF1697 family)